MGMRAWAILLSALVFSGVVATAAGQVVVLPGGIARDLTGVSDDGTRFTGRAGGTHSAYFWNAAQGFTFYDGRIGGGNNVPVFSGDGRSFAAPSTAFDTTLGHPIVVSDSGGLTVLPRVFSERAQTFPTSISRDGSVVCGWDQTDVGSAQAGWRWSATGGMQVLPGFNFTLSMSGDGRTIFGGNGVGQYGMWRDGVVSPVPDNFGRVQAVNYDASIFAGDGRIWNNGQITTLPLLPGAGNPEIIDMSEDGLVVVGTNALFGGGVVPIVWTPSTGTQPLAAYFASYGYDLSEYRVIDAHVSADGRTFGLATRSLIDNSLRGIIVTVPTPGAACLIVGLIGCAQRRRA
jgi:hypothetical protein